MVPLEVVDSDSDSNSDPQRLEAEDKGADGVPEVAGEAIPIVATDPDLLNCSICHYPLCTPIFLVIPTSNLAKPCAANSTRSEETLFIAYII